MSDQTNNAPMELLYIWINCDETEFIQQQGFNFSPIYQFTMTQDSDGQYKLSFENPKDYRNVWETNTITNLTAVVGENGSGKSTLLRYLANVSVKPIQNESPSGSKDVVDEIPENETLVKIYRCMDTNTIKVIHNLHSLTLLKFPEPWEEIRISDHNQENTDLEFQTPVYMTNALTASLFSEELSQKQSPLFFSPTINTERAKTFYHKISGIDWIAPEYIRKIRYKRFYGQPIEFAHESLHPFVYAQSIICDYQIKYFDIYNAISSYHQQDFAESPHTSIVTIAKDITVGVENIYNILIRRGIPVSRVHPLWSDWKFKGDIQKELNYSELVRWHCRSNAKKATYSFNGRKYPIHVFKNAIYALSQYLEFERDLVYNFHASTLSEEAKTKFENYFNSADAEITRLAEILDACEPNSKNIPLTKNDCAPRVHITTINPAHKEFCEYIDSLMKRELKTKTETGDETVTELSPMSFVLKYLSVEIPPMSSGEQALQNIFSWLRLPPYFDKLFGEESITVKDNILLLLDEVDLYMHPEWQRQFLDALSRRLEAEYSDKHIQVIISTHSPLVLSDIPLRNTIYLDKTGDKCTLADRSNTQESFGANLYSLLRDSFFLKKTTGEFSYGKMSDAYENLSTLRKITDLQKKIHDEPNQHSSVESPNQEIDTLLEERKASSKELKVLSESSEGLTAKTFKAYCQKYGSLIQMIGEPLIRRKLQALYDDLFLADNERECNKNLEELTRLLNSDDEQMRKKYRDALKNLLADSSSD